ncbi:MAG TPA: hypothetical protein VIH86_10655 [Puia sp.]
MIDQKSLAEAAAKNVKTVKPIFVNKIEEETETAKITSFTHGKQIRWTVYHKPVGQAQWKMVCQGYNEQLARNVFGKLKSGAIVGRI